MADSMLDRMLAELAGTPSDSAPRRIDIRSGGESYALAYSSLLWVHFRPSRGTMEVHFSTHTVWIEGSRLDAIYSGLLREELRTLEKAPPSEDEGPEINRLVVRPKKGNEPLNADGDVRVEPEEPD